MVFLKCLLFCLNLLHKLGRENIFDSNLCTVDQVLVVNSAINLRQLRVGRCCFCRKSIPFPMFESQQNQSAVHMQ